MRKKIWVPIIVIIVLAALAAGGVYAFLYRPVERAFAAAMQASRTVPYADAKEILTNAAQEIDGKPFAKERVANLNRRLDELLLEEADRAAAANELSYAADLLAERDPARAQSLRQAFQEQEQAKAEQARLAALQQAYDDAAALEQAGREEEALAAFIALGAYGDAAQRAEAIQARMALAAAKAVFTGTNFDEGIDALNALGTAEGRAEAETLQLMKEDWIKAHRDQYIAAAADQLCAGVWHTAAAGNAPWIAGDERYTAAPVQADKVFSGLTSVFYLADGRVLPTGETFGAEKTVLDLTEVKKVAPGLVHALFLHEDGHVTAVGSKGLNRLPKNAWKDMIDVAAGAWHSVGLKSDGTATACGTDSHGQCDVSQWQQITAVSAGLLHTVGLKADGTVVACGDNTYGQCDVGEWTDIVAISCGACTTVGLKGDGTVVACGDNGAGQCNVSNWTDVAAIAAGGYHTAALRLDGTVITAGLTPAPVPDEPVFASEWISAPASAPEGESPVATAYILGENERLGPWFYMDVKGIVLVCVDYSGDREVFRADLLATKNNIPTGRVTWPEASGNYIKMPAVLASEQALNHHAVLAFTGDYIGWTNNRKAVMIRNGKVYYDRKETTTLAVMPDGTLNFYAAGKTSAAELQALGVKDSFSFGPLLVNNGEKAYYNNGKDLFTTRVGFGYSDPFHYIVIVTPRESQTALSFSRLADYFLSYGARVAYNMDGGHSSSLVFMGHELATISTRSTGRYGNIRGLSDIVMFLENDAVGSN